jgi:hypothetical protein
MHIIDIIDEKVIDHGFQPAANLIERPPFEIGFVLTIVGIILWAAYLPFLLSVMYAAGNPTVHAITMNLIAWSMAGGGYAMILRLIRSVRRSSRSGFYNSFRDDGANHRLIMLIMAVGLSIDTMTYDRSFTTFCMMIVAWFWWCILNFLSCQDPPASRVSFARG